MFLNSFNQFRAIAILIIVAGHCFNLVGISSDSLLNATLINLISGSTALFVFISGFLFHYVFYKKYEYRNFVSKKIFNVLIPYFLLGFVPLLLHVSERMDQSLLETISNPGLIIENLVAPIVRNYVTGRFLTAYWYIPFIMTTFLLSPLHIKFIRINWSAQLFIVGVLSCIAIFMHRPMWNVNVLQSVVYYAPIYLIGIMASIYKDVVYKSLENKDFLLLAG